MTETDWMYDSLTERFGEILGERQKVVDALLIANAVAGEGALGSSNHEGIISVARFILDEWSKHSNAEDPEDSGSPVVLNIGVVTESDISLMKYGTHTFPEGSRWVNSYGSTLIFTDGKFLVDGATRHLADTRSYCLPFTRIPFTRIKGEN